eukprot:scaffold44118_cov226-Skeletonema_marinoi.AAC.2
MTNVTTSLTVPPAHAIPNFAYFTYFNRANESSIVLPLSGRSLRVPPSQRQIEIGKDFFHDRDG